MLNEQQLKKLKEISHHNTFVSACIGVYESGGITLEAAMLRMIEELVKQNKAQYDIHSDPHHSGIFYFNVPMFVS
ncbi:hypothetical protein [Paenibacillus hexagrammi]|uniref:Uncharacterized protein n=1 Tax=Paenibacillus hexagrammi TaxID=2908839 RepID=A0ABY3SMV7_9BACL|nr:hypothetical protein [Paenibacillus sp. YPD9-1]UJF34813.1 hypothetical protein L0M14_06560 [Paenibacillus sp. YPD9-1]